MSDAKLFRTANGSVSELKSSSIAVEKSLQTMILMLEPDLMPNDAVI